MRILLVDDDGGVVQAMLAILKNLPEHDVRSAGTGDEAIATAREWGGVDLLITDVVMEPMDGFTLRDSLQAEYPGMRTILISGYDLSDYPEQTQNYQLLPKPVEAADLRVAIAKEVPAQSEPESQSQPESAAEAPAMAEPTAPEPKEPVAETAPPPPAVEPEPTASESEPEPEPEPAAPAAAAPAPPAMPVPAVPPPTAVPRPTAVPAPPAMPPPAVPVTAAAPTPIAVPKAVVVPNPNVVPAAASIPKPTVRATAVPAPTAGTPVAKAVAVAPTSGVRAVPQPVATVKATAVPKPTAGAPAAAKPDGAPPAATPTARVAVTAKAQPVPTPTATPGPRATATGAPVARPSAGAGTPVKAKAGAAPGSPSVPQAKAPPTPTVPATPNAAPAGLPASAPSAPVSAQAVLAASGVAAPPAFPAPPTGDSGEDLSGRMFGAYQILRKTGEGRWGTLYAGVQTSINRPVALEILAAEKASDPVVQSRFVADARAKAGVQHPSILAVYEAGEAEGRFFYAFEYVDGQSVAELKAASKRLDEPTALKVLRVAADGLSYFNTNHTPHTPPDASSVFLGADGHPRLANLATQLSDEQLTPQQEIQALGRVMLGVLPAIQSLSPGLREILKRMVQPGPQALTSWGNLLQGIKAIEPRIIPTDAAKISAQDRAAIAAVEQARKQQKRALYYNLASVATLLILVGVTLWFFVIRSSQRIYDEQIQIPAGEFLFGNGEKKTLPDFWIDKYEVTYGQYAEFVKALEARPTTEYDHPQQPRIKNTAMHKPRYWEIFYGNAKEARAAHSTPIDLSCPVMEVDFWDAYAYAKWKGRELPTEEEWEKAARGTKGFIYPWGDDFDPTKINANADFNPNDPGAKGEVDGFNFWNPVDAIKSDESPFGIVGMAGNVREWTSTWDQVKKRPIVKGGSFMSSDVRLDQRTDLDPNAISESLGFRTISRTPPQ